MERIQNFLSERFLILRKENESGSRDKLRFFTGKEQVENLEQECLDLQQKKKELKAKLKELSLWKLPEVNF